jgi:tRNA U34 5-carboxymethylaminomethyl modifying enzyme MnmG/GidA
VFISECKKIATYVNATAEFTEQDLQNKEIQAAYVKEYRDMIKGMKPAKVTVIRNDFDYDDVEALPVPAQKELAPVMTSGEFDFNPDDDDYYAQIALNNI